jgi:SAM-dependent methyltransferase
MKLIPYILKVIPRRRLITLSYYVMRVTGFIYRGNNVECPVCGRTFRKFLPYGYNKIREGVLCPRCFSLERHRLLWLFLKNRTDFFSSPLKVLHVAPEQCFFKRFREMKNLWYITADLESPLADVKLDVQSMPFNNDTFDVVICNHVLEHVEDDGKAIAEIRRILKPGGYAIMQVPFNSSMEKTYEDTSITDPLEREKHFRQKDHLRLYGKDYPERVAKYGLRINHVNYIDEVTEEMRQRYVLPAFEFMYAFYRQ